MSQQDDTIGDALERLEWSDKKLGDVPKITQITRRVALTGGAAGLTAALLDACGGSGARQEERKDTRRRVIGLRGECRLQVHVRQPCDDQLVLHADHQRGGGRVHAARLLIRVDGLGIEQRRPYGQRDSTQP